MKIINLYFDFEFTSLSPDAQPISLGIVSEDIEIGLWLVPEDKLPTGAKHEDIAKFAVDNPGTAKKISKNVSKSFYAEFSDFDINRCDDWVKENVVSKLMYIDAKHSYEKYKYDAKSGSVSFVDTTNEIKEVLKAWLKQFSDYQIQFICDCGTWDWYWMVQLLAEWEEVPGTLIIPEGSVKEKDIEEIARIMRETPTREMKTFPTEVKQIGGFKIGLPKLPSNISPVPEDLNDLIARAKGITVREAFDLNREELIYPKINSEYLNFGYKLMAYELNEAIKNQKHSAIWDAKVIKEIYQKLK